MRFLLGSLLASALLPWTAQAKTCLLLYQLADNNLEYFIRQDYQELSQSPVVSSENLRVWVYYDALNQGGAALPNTITSDGQQVGGFLGSRYMTYDRNAGRMVVAKELPGEVNSDDWGSIAEFYNYALSDCLPNGYTSLMGVFSSHGGGFAGYGGDENGRRGLMQTNKNIATAISTGLSYHGLDRLEVLGFDACLMQAVGAADDYMNVADYILASEAVEPGHGWAYSLLSSADRALDLAVQIAAEFIARTQGGSSHQSPKTIGVIDTAKFATFINAWEGFSAELLSELQAGDGDLYAYVSRARSQAVAYEGIVDAVGSRNPSALDIGSFLQNFYDLCQPGEPLATQLFTAKDAYDKMFIYTQTGPGTSRGTGMHITWPNQGEYRANTALWDQVLFQNANYATAITPNFKSFLQWFLPSNGVSGGGTTCGIGAQPNIGQPADQGQEQGQDQGNGNADPNALFIQDSGTSAGEGFSVDAVISPKVSQVLVEYGVDLSTPLKPVLVEKGQTPRDEDYLVLLGGDVAGNYNGADYEATWDGNFYFLNITETNTFEALYVFDQGDGSKKIPAMYFPEDKREEVANLQFLEFLFFDFDKWIGDGARFSFLKFSVNETEGRINDNLSLFISNDEGVFAEQPREFGGLLIPIVYIDAFITGRVLDTLPGGFNQTVIEWNTETTYNILTTPYANIFNVIPDTDAILVNMYAYNHADDSKEPEARYYDVQRNRGTKPDVFLEEQGVDLEAVKDEQGDASGSVRNAFHLSLVALLALCFGLA